MSLICPQCGAENRDSAKFCLKCAHQLVPLGAATEPPAEPRKRRRKRRPVAQDQPARRRQMLLWGVVLVGALIGMGIFIGRWGAQPAVPGATTASASAAARQAPASANPPTTLAQAATAPTSAPESAALMRAAEALQQLHTQTSAPTPHASATVTAAHVSASAAKPAARRAPPKAPPAPAPTPVAARPAAPRELCAGTQFLARGLCLQTECNKPSQQKHPQCAQLREQQEAMRQGTGGG